MESKLRKHQVEPANRLIDILSNHNSAVDLSDTGTGKTYVASAVAGHFNQPTLVIAPKIALTAWRRAAEHFGDSFSVINYELLRMGHSGLGQWENQEKVDAGRKTYFTCQCCQQVVDVASPEMPACYTHPAGIHCVIARKKTVNYGRFVFHSGIKFAIFDEVHRCGGLDSLNAELLIAAKWQGIRTLGLSATAACSPLNMRALGYLLDLHNLAGFYSWARKYKCWNDPQFRGFKWFAGRDEQLNIMSDIRDTIIPSRGVRVRTTDIPGFPKRQVLAELYDVENIQEIDELYAQMAEALADLKQTQVSDKSPDHPLTKILRARQRLEILKVPLGVELCEDLKAKGYSVVLFVNFKATIRELSRRLSCSDIIDGEHIGEQRQASIDRFQANQTNQIILNNEAGGVAVSLHDTDGNFPRIGLVFPMHSAVTFQQVMGRLPRDGGKSDAQYRIILAAGTVEVRMKRALDAKSNNLSALNDGDFSPV